MSPNPFAASTSLRLVAANGVTPVELSVYDSRGRLLRRLLNEPVRSERLIEWDGRDDAGGSLASGVYFMRARQGSQSASHRVILLK